MIKHIVFFKLPEKFTQKDLLVEKLNNLKDQIDLIKALEVGINFAQSNRAFDISLTVVVKNKEDLQAYAIHENHLPVVEFIKSNGIETKVVDYEIAKQGEDEFGNATIVKKANIHHDGQVTSRTIIEANGTKKTLGIMMPGSYTFNTIEAEHMEILEGKVEVELFGSSSNSEVYTSKEYFEVPANSGFDIKVFVPTDYCCTYIK